MLQLKQHSQRLNKRNPNFFIMTVLDDVLKLLGRQKRRAQRKFEKTFQVVTGWWRKVIGTLYYCGGKKWIYTAWTFEENETNRKDWLRVQLESELEDTCSFERQLTGYELLDVNESDVDMLAVYDSWDFSRTPAK